MTDLPDRAFLVCSEQMDRLPRIFPHAVSFAHACDARLTVVHVAPPGTGPDARAERERALEGALRGVEAAVEISVLDGGEHQTTAEVIARAADERAARLIALDSRDLSTIRHALRGSTAMDVVAATRLPVMVASTRIQPARSSGIYRLLVATDGSSTSDGAVASVRSLLALARVSGTLTQLYIPRIGDHGNLIEMDSCERHLEDLRQRLASDADVRTHIDMPEGLESVPRALLRVADNLGVDAIVMGTRGSSAARHILVGSVALAVAQNSPVPVILLRS